jgi:hypothetical protein
MRCWSRVLILLTVALVALNAQCFAYCLTQPADSNIPHCHQHGQAKCTQQHDLTPSSAIVALPAGGHIAAVQLPALAMNLGSRHGIALLAASPPAPQSLTTPLPLRI